MKQTYIIIAWNFQRALEYAEKLVIDPTTRCMDYFENENGRYLLRAIGNTHRLRGNRAVIVYVERKIYYDYVEYKQLYDNVLYRLDEEQIIFF